MKSPIVICPYCQQSAPLVTGADIYPHRPDLAQKYFYKCSPCDAWVGTHDGTNNPLGRLANARLRALKMAVHAAFDPYWQPSGRTLKGAARKSARGAAYARLAADLGVPMNECHVGMFDEARCEHALRVLATWKKQAPQEMRA